MQHRSLLLAALLAAACNSSIDRGDPQDTAPDLAPPTYADFPATPILDTGGPTPVPANAADLFSAPGAMDSGGPCLLDPDVEGSGALFPSNWLRLRVHFAPPAGQSLFEIRIRAGNQRSDLVVYTTATTWIMPSGLWGGLRQHTQDAPITITVRGAAFDGQKLTAPPARGTTGAFTIAPVTAEGSIVYWTTSNGTALRGFRVGDETVRDVLRPSQAGTACVGCHSSTPEGDFVGMSASDNAGDGTPARAAIRSVDGQAKEPAYVTDAARALLARTMQQAPTYSRAHYRAGDRIQLSMFPVSGRTEIIWTDLEATSTDQGKGWGVIGRGGDGRMAASANPSHDGQRIVYVSAPGVGAGVIHDDGDLYSVPFGDRQGGQAAPIPGASDPAFNEYYPVLSPDDGLIAFNRVAAGKSSYNNADAEVFVVPAQGGQALRLVGNDPPACGGKRSPGITNSWPKWSPAVGRAASGGQARSYYWLTFSSTRGEGGNPQIYVVGVVADGAALTSYKAIYLWNQPAAESNHTPAWDVFRLAIE